MFNFCRHHRTALFKAELDDVLVKHTYQSHGLVLKISTANTMHMFTSERLKVLKRTSQTYKILSQHVDL